MFSRTERCGRSAWRRSAGTSTTPARIASYGWRAFSGVPRDADLAGRGADARRRAHRTARPGPGPRARRSPSTSPGREREGDAVHAGAAVRPSTSSEGVSASVCRDPGQRSSAARPPRSPPGRRPRRACARRSAPRRPPRGTIVATAPPSRRIVARSHARDHLLEAVRDEEDGAPALAPVAHHRRRRARRGRTAARR